jgi:hypothetical protein
MVDELTCFGSDRRFCSWWLNQWLVWLYNMHCTLRYMLRYAIYYNRDSSLQLSSTQYALTA